jgi:hypothetical protein
MAHLLLTRSGRKAIALPIIAQTAQAAFSFTDGVKSADLRYKALVAEQRLIHSQPLNPIMPRWKLSPRDYTTWPCMY